MKRQTKQQPEPEPEPERTTHQSCLCRELLEVVQNSLGISPAARRHFENARLEVLLGIREILNERIAAMSSKGATQGTKVTIE